jgi:hypothetical protein
VNQKEPAGPNAPFQRDRIMDKPGIVGARWWQASLADKDAAIARRHAIRNILIAGGLIAGFGAVLALIKAGSSAASLAMSSSGAGSLDPDSYREARQASLEMQRAYGWDFGARGEPLVFDGATTKPFDARELPNMKSDLSPARADLVPYNQQALFQSPYAVPTKLSSLAPEERIGWHQLVDSLKPVLTVAMEIAYRRGRSLASLFAALPSPSSAKAAVVVDLPGPEAVAFAAGAVGAFDPVFLFDNWPHPRGVVRSHETLSAAAYYQPLFAKARAAAGASANRAPMFVLDRRRITPYSDDAKQFDNRYVAKLPPTAAKMKALGVEHVLYAVPSGTEAYVELDDLNEDFVGLASEGVDVKAIGVDAFRQATSLDAGVDPADSYFYGGVPDAHYSFFTVYPWVKPPRPAKMKPTLAPGADYRPAPRTTPYSSNASSSAATRPLPSHFGTVPVVVAVATGAIVGSRGSRSGSWNRSTGGGWSG